MAPVIEAHNLSKRYRLGASGHRFDRITELVSHGLRKQLNNLGKKARSRTPAEWIWGLEDVSFEIQPGEVVGVIGANGAGKSTLLKILSRITDPTSGYVWLRGRASSLLEVGTGFHPDLTGRENIYLNGSILGMSKMEVDSKLEEIVAFCEIGSFLDTPVKRYSSGMFVRLAFAVAAHLDPEILIVDEVLAVGDMAFQKKCLGKMGDAGRDGRTVLFVSHNLAMLENLCDRGIVLKKGRLVYDGGAQEAINFYVHSVFGQRGKPEHSMIDLTANVNRLSQFHVPRLQQLWLDGGEGGLSSGVLSYGSALQIRIRCQLEQPIQHLDALLSFNSLLGQPIFVASSGFDPGCVSEELVGEHTFICDIPCFSLVPGEYMVNVALASGDNFFDCVEDVARISVIPSDHYGTGRVPKHGLSVLSHRWSLRAGNSMPEYSGLNQGEQEKVTHS